MSGRNTILVAVDDETVAEFVAALVQERGGRAVSVVTTAEQALRKMSDLPVGCVVADLIPPRGMDSFQLAVIVAERYPGVPVICAGVPYSPRFEKNAASTIIPKPYR